MTLLWLGLVIGIAWALTAFRAPLPVTTALLGAALLLWTTAGDGGAILVIAWLLFLVVLVPFSVTPLRRRWISAPALAWFRGVMPEMSRTEREALDAGTVWWEGELFGGSPRWQRLLGLPQPVLSAEERAFLDGPVEALCRRLDDWRISEELHDLPEDVWRLIREERFFGMIIPRRYGGLGFSALAHSAVVMKIATRSIAAAVTVMVPNSLGPAELLLRYGTEAQKTRYLGPLARGEEVPCFALTGPEAGSDASSVPDTGVVCRGEFEGREVLGIRLDWEKRYITLGPVATVIGLAFRLRDPDGLLGGQPDRGITLALIPATTPGVMVGARHDPLDIAFQNGPVRGRDVFIPLDWVIGGRDGVGQGWRMLMESLAAGRGISLPALGTGAGKLVCRYTGAYARIRRQFRQPIGRFEGVEEVLARIAGNTYVMDAAREATAQAIDIGEHPAVASAIVKYHLTERMRQVVNDGMDIQGGSGICMGPRNVLGRVYQAVPISITVEGANILTRSLIIFGQGAIRCHPYVLREMGAAAEPDPDAALDEFDRALSGHIGFMLGNAARALWHGLTGAHLLPVPGAPATRRYWRQAGRMSAAFALLADASMLVLGGDLKRKEYLSGRLADVLGQLYLMTTALRRFEVQGRPAEDEAFVRWGCEDALRRAQDAVDALLRNFPNRFVARLLSAIVFPLGRPYRGPDDATSRAVASAVMTPGPARERLTAGVHVGGVDDDPVGRADAALALAVEAEAVERKLRAAVRAGRIAAAEGEDAIAQALAAGVIDAHEADAHARALTARREVIKVDEFPEDYWTARA